MKNITKTFVGVDVSKNQLDIYLHPTSESIFFSNSKEGIDRLIERLSGYTIEQIVCESTGGYENLMLNMLRENGYKVWQVEPNRIKSFIRSKGGKAKTDTIDAKMMALFSAQEIQKHEYVEKGKNHAIFRGLVKRKDDLTAMIVTEKLRLKHPSCIACPGEIKLHIEFMEKQLKDIERKIKNHIDEDKDLSKKVEIIESIPGVGKGTSAKLIADMPELGNIENNQAAALIGVAPYTKESGQYKGKSYISGGRISVRSALYMAALVASRHNPILKKFYRRLRDVGKKPAKVALVAVMRKLIIILNTMLKKQTKWSFNVDI